jgi:ligand-binding sensor domain-containing protein
VFPPYSCRCVLLAGFFWLLAPALFAAGTNDEWLTRWLQTEDGLPDNSVSGVAQTPDGYLWVGTPTGFDGLQFETISLTNVIPEPNSGIITMMQGRHNALWLAMDRGAVVRLSGSTSRAFIKDLPNFIPNGMAEDAAGDLWIAYRGGTVYRVRDDQTTLMTAEHGMPPGSEICALTTDRRGGLWFAKAGQVGVFSNGLFHVLQQLESQPMRLAPAQVGGIWVCCGFHIYKLNGQGDVQDFGEFHPENIGTVTSVLLEDREGNVWIGTAFSGLYRRSQSGFQAIPTSHNEILSLLEDREGNIWAGTHGGGLNCIRRRAITLEDAGNGLPYPSIQSICEAVDGTIWAVTQNRVLVHQVAGRWSAIPISANWPADATCVNADARGTVWVGTSRHGLYCWHDGKFVDWDGAAALRGQTFHTLLTATNGDLWMAGNRLVPSCACGTASSPRFQFPRPIASFAPWWGMPRETSGSARPAEIYCALSVKKSATPPRARNRIGRPSAAFTPRPTARCGLATLARAWGD